MRTFTRRQLAQRCTLSESDLVEIRRRWSGHTRLGFAYQLGFSKMMGRLPKQEPLELVPELLAFVGLQVEEDPRGFEEYQQSRRTIAEHQDRIREHLGLKRLGPSELAALEGFVFEAACQLEHVDGLQSKAREFLREQRIILPANSTLTRIVGEHRERARQQIYRRIVDGIPEQLAHTLDELLVVGDTQAVSELQRIKDNPSNPSVDGMLSLIDKIGAIKATGVLGVDLSWLSRNYQRALFHYARKASGDRLRGLGQPRRHATLVCFLWQSHGDAIDQAVDMFDKILVRTSTKAQNELDERMRQQRTLVSNSMSALRALGMVLLDDSIADTDVRLALFEQVPRETLAGYVEDVAEWVSGKSSDAFNGFTRRYGVLRKFTPAFLEAIRFQDEGATESPCLQAVEMLKSLNEEGKRKLPENVTTDFVTKRLRRFVVPDGKVDRRAWECSLLLQLRKELRSGNVSVENSKRFRRLDDFFMPEEQWEARREQFFARAGLPSDPREVADHLGHRLGKAFDRFLDGATENEYAKVDADGWHLSVDPTKRPNAELLESRPPDLPPAPISVTS